MKRRIVVKNYSKKRKRVAILCYHYCCGCEVDPRNDVAVLVVD